MLLDRRSFLISPGAAALLGAAAVPEMLRPPDHIAVQRENELVRLGKQGKKWTSGDVEVTADPNGNRIPVTLSAPKSGVSRIRLRWNTAIPEDVRILGDHWERSYGDLEWRGHFPDRLLPWYFLTSRGGSTAGYGVKTGASAIAYWQADPAGFTLWLDVRNGGSPVQLGERTLLAATAVMERSKPGESAIAFGRRFCKVMCEQPRLPLKPVYGGNNWYYTYGKDLSAAALLRDADLMAELSPSSENRPFLVLDMGWTAQRDGAGPIEKLAPGFSDMAELAEKIKAKRVRPGIWVRPLLTMESLPQGLRLSSKAPFSIYDPSAPDALARIEADMKTISGWGYEMIKHDFTTYDITGRWGFQMGPELTGSGWHFADRSKTTAEVIAGMYAAIRKGAGESLLIGCNTVGHLGAGLFELQRIGDDTSGREWSRTRKMGVNTLAFRMAQHNTFFAADADCVPLTAAIPWNLSKQWLDLVARSGTPLFVSADPAITGEKEQAAVRTAFATAAKVQHGLEPLDWMETTVPMRWKGEKGITEYRWYEDER